METLVPEEPQSKRAWSEPIRIYDKDYLLWHFPLAGCRIHKHTHKFDHATQLLRGKFLVYGDAELREGKPLTAFDTVYFKAGVEHSIVALSDEAMCMHFYRNNADASDGG